MNKLISVNMTYRDFHTPELSSHLASHLQCNLGSHSHECLRSAESTGNHTLAGNGAVYAKVLFDAVVLVLPVGGEDHHHLTNRNDWKVSSLVHKKCHSTK